MIEWKSVGRFLTPAALVLALPSMALAADCVVFDGIEHCAIGKARLSTTGSGVEVTGLGAASTDGVRLSLGGTTFWEMGTEVKGNAEEKGSLVVTAFASGSPASRMTVQQNGSLFTVSAQFTGGGLEPTYTAHVYQMGRFQDGRGGIRQGVPFPLRPIYSDIDWALRRFVRIGDVTFGLTQTGACIYGIRFLENVAFALSDDPNEQPVYGDYVEIIEEVPQTGGYPYLSFDEVQVTGGKLDLLTITSQTVRK